MKIGIMGLQGSFQKHVDMLEKVGIKTEVVRYSWQFDSCDGLIIPGGESTTMAKIIEAMGIRPRLDAFDRPIFGTCAGAILLAKCCDDPKIRTLNRIPIKALRNAYGRQVDSFTERVNLSFDDMPFPAVFIRAPKLTDFSDGVEILGKFNGETVMVRYQQYLISTFHPELTNDTRIHEYFIQNMFN